MTFSIYKGGLERITPTGWAARAADEALLIEDGTGFAFNVDHVSLTSLNLGTTEFAGANYVRKAVVPSTPTWSTDEWRLGIGAIVWTSLGTAEDLVAIVGYEAGVDDANSVPLWCCTWSPVITLDGTDFTVSPNASGLLTIEAG